MQDGVAGLEHVGVGHLELQAIDDELHHSLVAGEAVLVPKIGPAFDQGVAPNLADVVDLVGCSGPEDGADRYARGEGNLRRVDVSVGLGVLVHVRAVGEAADSEIIVARQTAE